MPNKREDIAYYLYKCFGKWKEPSFYNLSELNKQGWLQYADEIITIIKGDK